MKTIRCTMTAAVLALGMAGLSAAPASAAVGQTTGVETHICKLIKGVECDAS